MSSVCRRCGENEVRRERRQRWMKTLAYVVPLRPQICGACDARSWSLLQAGDGILPWLSSAAIWTAATILVLQFVPVPLGSVATKLQPSAESTQAVARVRPEPATVPALIDNAVPMIAATAAPTPTPKPVCTPKASAKAVTGKLRLRSMDVAVKDDVVEVVLDSDADDLKYTLRKSSRVNGYVIDLTGKWTLPRDIKMTRDFSTTKVAQLRVGLHDNYFRVVFDLRDNTAGPPVIEAEGGRLHIRSQ